MGDYERCGIRSECFKRHEELGFLYRRYLRLEHRGKYVALLRSQVGYFLLLLTDKIVDYVGVDAYKVGFFKLLFKQTYEMAVKLSVHHKHTVSLVGCRVYVVVLRNRVGGVQIDYIAIFVGLVCLDKRLIFIKGVIFSCRVFYKHKLHCPLSEFFISEHAVLDEELYVVPFLLVFVATVFEYLFKAIGNLTGDVNGNFLHGSVTLEI